MRKQNQSEQEFLAEQYKRQPISIWGMINAGIGIIALIACPVIMAWVLIQVYG